MKPNRQVLDLFVDLQKKPYDWRKNIINKPNFLKEIEEALECKEITSLRKKTYSINSIINYPKGDRIGLLNFDRNGDTAALKKVLYLKN
jgi:hypothetical protein